MQLREKINRKMSQISQPVDVDVDPFANLFNDRNGFGREPARSTPTDFAEMREQASNQRIPRIRQETEKSDGGLSIYAWLPVVGFALCGIFLIGAFAGNISGGTSGIFSNQVAAENFDAGGKQVGKKITAAAPRHKLFSKGLSVPIIRKQKIALAGVSVPVMKTANAAPAKRRTNSVAELLSLGHQFEVDGDIASARLKFQAAFDAGSSAAALAIARTYDVRSYRQGAGRNIAGFGNKKLARQWYETWFLAALEAGEISPRARYDRLLKGLGSS